MTNYWSLVIILIELLNSFWICRFDALMKSYPTGPKKLFRRFGGVNSAPIRKGWSYFMKTHSRLKTARNFLIFWTLFIGSGAVAGALCMLIDPTGRAVGMDGMLPFFQVLPFAEVLFQNLTFSGVMLLIVNGVTNLTAAGLLFAKKKAGIILGGIFGVTLMLWICIQFYIFPLNFMSTSFFIFGLLQAVTGYAAWVFFRQETFRADISDYQNIGRDPERLVVFFSRMGYARKLAYEEANRTGAVIYEIKSTERTEGTLGFWWCGRYGMHGWEMPIQPVGIELSAYRHVTICSPIWVFALAAPVRAFCRAASGKVAEADYILVHHQNSAYKNAADEMDAILGIKRTGLRSVRCREGSFKEKVRE